MDIKYKLALIGVAFIVGIIVVCLITVNAISPSKSSFKTLSNNTTQALTAINANINSATAEQKTLRDLINATSESLKKLSDTQTAQATSIKEIGDKANSYYTQIDSLNDKIVTLNNNITDLQNQINSKLGNSEISEIKASLDELKALANTNTTTLSSLQNDVNDLKTRVRYLELYPSGGSGGTIIGVTKLIGANDVPATTHYAGNLLILARFQCEQTGMLYRVRMRATASGNVKVALYSDNGSAPNTLLAVNNNDNAVTSGINELEITPASISQGTYYWLSFISDTPCIGANSGSVGTVLYKAMPYLGFTYSTSAGTGYIASSYLCLISGWTD